MLPQSTVVLRVSRNYSKVAYLKRSKSRNSEQCATMLDAILVVHVAQYNDELIIITAGARAD